MTLHQAEIVGAATFLKSQLWTTDFTLKLCDHIVGLLLSCYSYHMLLASGSPYARTQQ